MRTTIDLPPDLDAIARSIARDQGRSLSAVVADLMRRGLGTDEPAVQGRLRTRSGFPLLDLGGPITTDDVRRLQDDE